MQARGKAAAYARLCHLAAQIATWEKYKNNGLICTLVFYSHYLNKLITIQYKRIVVAIDNDIQYLVNNL